MNILPHKIHWGVFCMVLSRLNWHHDNVLTWELFPHYLSFVRRIHQPQKARARFLSLTRSKLRLCSANHRPGYFSNLACDWLSIVWAYSEQETEIGPRNADLWFVSLLLVWNGCWKIVESPVIRDAMKPDMALKWRHISYMLGTGTWR